jgi:hypothetical protein
MVFPILNLAAQAGNRHAFHTFGMHHHFECPNNAGYVGKYLKIYQSYFSPYLSQFKIYSHFFPTNWAIEASFF